MAPPLAVAFDASLDDEPTTGIGLYGRCLAAELEAIGVRVLRVGAKRSGEAPRGALGRTAFALGRLPEALRRLDAPLFHGVGNFNLPLTRVPAKRFILTVHDLIPLVLPDTVSLAFRAQFRLWLWRSLRVADRIVCVSERTRADLRARFDVDGAKLEVVRHGVDHVCRVPAPDAVGEQYLRALSLPARFALYAGALDKRKNVELVLEACGQLHRRGRPVTLVLAGQRWFGSAPVERLAAELRADGLDVRSLGYVADPIFYALMRRATVFVFPSRYEGFGLPPLEAMRLGTPAIISTAASLPEICGEAAVAVDPDDARGLADAIDRLMRSDDERARRALVGRAHAERFTWRACAEATAQVYREALADQQRWQ